MSLLATVLPSFLIILVLVISDKFREPTPVVLKSFFWGIAICLPAGYLNTYLIWSQPNPEDFTFLAALTEEPLKFMVIFFFLKSRTEFNEPMDAIVYGTAISLGFATLENFQYVFQLVPEGDALTVAMLRAFSAIPMHAACGVMMGYFFARYIFSGERKAILWSILVPIIFHGSYNFTVGHSLGFGIAIIVTMIILCDRLHREFLRGQSLKNSEQEERSV